MDVQSPIQDCIDVKVAGAYKSKVLGGIYHLFVSEYNLNHLNLFLPSCLTDKWDMIPRSFSIAIDIIVTLDQ